MKKLVRLIACLALVATLAGCGNIIAARDFLADPKTQAAANILIAQAKAGATLISCFVGAGSAIALDVERQAGSSGQYATGIIYTASSDVCAALSGVKSGTVQAAGGETVVTAATPAP